MAVLGTDILGSFGPRNPGLDGRQMFVLGIVFAAFAFLCFYTLRLGLSGHGQSRARLGGEVRAVRADIVDRNGEILARNVYAFDLVLNARRIKDADRAAAFVHSVFPEISINETLEKISTGRGYIEVRRDIGRGKAAKIRAERIEGVDVVAKQAREYPKGRSMSHIVGFVNSEDEGALGMERIANTRLKNYAEPLKLSIDSRIQSVMWSELSAAMTEYRAKAAIGILMNARTGEIIAAVSLPDFDPNDLGTASDENLRFKVLRDNFEMGSILKVQNTALALSNGMPMGRTFNVADPFLIAGRRIDEARGFRPPARNLNMAQIMQFSSNSGSAQIALALPDGAQIEFFRALYFDRVITTNFGRTERPLFPSSFTPTDRSRWAFGHGLSMSPLHALLSTNAMVNDGKFIMPTIEPRDFVPNTRQIISAEISRQVRQVMLLAMDTTGRAAAMQIQGINVGGKTSTAQKLIGGRYSDTRNVTAFFSAWPIEAPRFSMLIMLDEPQTTPRTSAFNAVPTAGRIMDIVIPLL